MDNFKTLFEKGEYELVIKISKNSNNVDDLFYCLSAFLALNKIEEALKFISDKFAILKERLPMLMKTHIELLCLGAKFDEAYEKIAYYKELPYYSQEAEETLKELPKIVREYEANYYKSHNKSIDYEQINKDLSSLNDYEVLNALDSLRSLDITPYLDKIQNLLVNYPKQSVRSFALLFLVQRVIDKDFDFLHIDKVIKVNPSRLNPPFIGDDFVSIQNKMQELYRDVSITNNAVQLLSSYLIYIYPEEVDLTSMDLIEAFHIIACKYLSIPYISEKEKELEPLIKDINEALENF